MPENVLKVTDIKKAFAGVKALKGVSLEIKEGEIHCLAGENGSGKSTLIKIISGVYDMDFGSIEIGGQVFKKISPIESIMHGIQVIYQDFSIFPNLSVIENLAFNSELASKRKFVDWKRFRRIAEEAVAKIGFQVDFNAMVGDLSVADKQLVAICRALINNAKLIIMDEPTTALTRKEVDNLFSIIKDLKSRGIATLFVSHKLDEVFEISEKFTILRNGSIIQTGDTSDLDNEIFTYYMTGRKFENKHFSATIKDKKPVLELKDLTLKNGFTDISFSLCRGEILGITGLLGSGRTELALALYGILKADSGDIIINGKKTKIRKVSDAIKARIGYVPEDRLTEGLFLHQSIGNNIVISKLKKLANKFGIINRKNKRQEIDNWVKRLSIATPNPDNDANTLSGGNQQRIVLAKALAQELDVLILNGPTVGVDIGSKHDIHAILQELANEGLAVIIISDDLREVITNCSRLLIMRGGKIVGEEVPDALSAKMLSQKITARVVQK